MSGRIGWVVAAWIAVGCGGDGDCTETTCDTVCQAEGTIAPEPERALSDCVRAASDEGEDLVLRDGDGAEVFSCRTVLLDSTQEHGTCSLDYDLARIDYCGCGNTYPTTGTP